MATARPQRLVFREGEVQGDGGFLKGRGAFYNGAVAVDEAIGLYAHRPIPGETVSAAVGVIESSNPDTQIALQFEERLHSFRLPMTDSDLRSWGFAREELVPFADARLWDCSKMLAFDESRDLADAYTLLKEQFDQGLTVFQSDAGSWIQVTSRQATKEGALTCLLRARGIAADCTIVFGDGSPDVGMLRTFQRSVAMGNASEAAKKAASYVTKSNSEDGVVYALHEYFGLI